MRGPGVALLVLFVAGCDEPPSPRLELRDADGPLDEPVDFKNPAPEGAPVSLEVDCLPNADAPVTFELTVLRRANQGFFDVAVNFEDLFCSAKIDCERDDGQTLDLLFDPDSGQRVPSIVMALACTGGLAADTHLWVDRPRLISGATEVLLPIDTDEPGNLYTTNPAGPVRQMETRQRGAAQRRSRVRRVCRA